jgi:general secretion pathway protein D
LRYFLKLPLVVLATAALVLSSCTSMDSQTPGTGSTTGVTTAVAPEGLTVGGAPATDPLNLDKIPREVPNQAPPAPAPIVPSVATLYRGTDEVIRMPAPQQPVQYFGDAVSLNFEQAPLTEVVHAIMGDILGLDYVVEHPIDGEITLRTRTPVPRDQLLGILESLLQANKALMVRDSGGRFFISASGQMSKLKPSVAASTSGVVGYSTIVVPLQYISAANMAEILRPVAEEGSFVRIDSVRNLLMLAGSRAQLEGWQDIITTFDVDLLKGMSVGIFPIENSPIEEIETALSTLLGKDGGGGGGGGGLAEDVAGIGSMVRIIPVARLNSIMVVTPRAQYLERIKVWIERLDLAPDANFEQRLYVYPVQNTSATHLADMLSVIFAEPGGNGKSGKAGVAPGLTPEKVSSPSGSEGGISEPTSKSSSNSMSGSTTTSARKSSKGSAESADRSVTVGGMRVVADEQNNALLIYATGKEYRKIESALERLDIAATQVIIEASIIEVTLTDKLEYGLEWAFNTNLGNGYNGLARLVDQIPLLPKATGFSYSVIDSSGDVRAVLSALAEDNLLNVISSPSVMVLDNQTAEIQVGEQVPVTTGTTTTDGGNTTQSIDYKDTGVQLTVTPSVNAGGMVTMDVEQSVTDVGAVNPSQSGNRSFLQRKVTSRVAVRSSESVVLGGLIRENKSDGSSGIPILHSLPVIGALFGNKAQDTARTELLVVITPRVIYSDSDLRDVSRQMRSQMQGLELIDVSKSSSFLTDKDSHGQAKSQ